MYKAIFEIYHKGCWGSDIGLQFSDIKFYSIDVRWVKGKVAHIVKATGNNTRFDEIINYYKNRKEVNLIEELSRSDEEIYIRTITDNNPEHPSFSNMFFEKNCFPIEPTRFVNKYEIWTLGSAKKTNLTNVFNKLCKNNEVNIKFIKQESINAELTQKQRDIFMYAKYFGYYNWPRHKTATEIAQILKIPKTVFLSHLRKAENKILNKCSY